MSTSDSSTGLLGLVNYGHDSEGSEGEDIDDEDNTQEVVAALLPAVEKSHSPKVSIVSAPSSLVAYQQEEDAKVDDGEDTNGKEENQEEEEGSSSQAPEEGGARVAELGTIADISEDEDEEEGTLEREAARLKLSITSEPETALSMKIRRMSADEVVLPQEPKGRCSKALQDRLLRYSRKTVKMNESIQKRKDFRNPSIYEKLISYLGIDELGTNYPKDVYDPHHWSESSYYESLAKAQKEEMAKRDKEKKERTKVEFVSGIAKKPSIKVEEQTGIAVQRVGEEERKRKTKWDAPAPNVNPHIPIVMLITNTITQPTVVSTTTSAKGNKTTIISAIGTIKKAKIEKVEKKE